MNYRHGELQSMTYDSERIVYCSTLALILKVSIMQTKQKRWNWLNSNAKVPIFTTMFDEMFICHIKYMLRTIYTFNSRMIYSVKWEWIYTIVMQQQLKNKIVVDKSFAASVSSVWTRRNLDIKLYLIDRIKAEFMACMPLNYHK